MNLTAILEGISEAGKTQIEAINAQAEEESATILEKAKQEAFVQRAHILKDGQIRKSRQCAIIEQQAVMRSLQLKAKAREKLIQQVVEKAKEKLDSIRGEKSYAQVLYLFIEQALNAIRPSLLQDQSIIIHADIRDKKLIELYQKKLTMPIEIAYDLTCLGGCIVETDDGMIRTLNTIESRFEHAFNQLQQSLLVFFEEKTRTG